MPRDVLLNPSTSIFPRIRRVFFFKLPVVTDLLTVWLILPILILLLK